MSLFKSLPTVTDKPNRRVGLGFGSGKGGHTSGRGTKGQKSRTGSKVPLWFEGGQLPLIKRLPMTRGKAKFKVVRPTAEISLTVLNNMKADTISLETLKLEKLINHRFAKAKIIASGQLKRAITIQGIGVSKAAETAITQAGGQIVR